MRNSYAPMANHRWMLGGLLVLLLAALPAAAAPQGTVAEIENTGSKLVFYPVVENDRVILTVTGPCNYVYREVIERGDVGIFRLSEETIDAPYTFQLVAIPKVSPEIVQVLKEARLEDDYSQVNALCREGEMPGDPLTQAEGFLIDRGEIIYDPGSIEEGAGAPGSGSQAAGGGSPGGIPLKDFVINDDLIVDGSACIGFDCVDGESFGFDTIRVKENNLRIKFDDTSTAASYPRNDWQLTANDSANGGASKFSIDDISGNRTPFTVEANARSHSLYVDDGGRIGSRTSTPSTEIHTIDGDTPTLRLQQDGSSGFAPQTWDVAGNETNFFIRDVTNGSQLPFRIRPDAPTSSIFIDVDGDVGMGTSSPDAALHVNRATNNLLRIENTTAASAARFAFVNGDGVEWRMTNSTAGTFRLAEQAGGGIEFEIDDTGNVTITGNLVTGGGGTCDPGPCDGTFGDYELESIEAHAEYMWQNRHLWGVGPTPEGAPINLSKKTTGILHELEKAHIYIEQLNGSLKGKDAEIGELQARLAALEEALGLAPAVAQQ